MFCSVMCVCSTAEAVLQEMDNISSIRQNREVERLRMWTGDTEEVTHDPPGAGGEQLSVLKT